MMDGIIIRSLLQVRAKILLLYVYGITSIQYYLVLVFITYRILSNRLLDNEFFLFATLNHKHIIATMNGINNMTQAEKNALINYLDSQLMSLCQTIKPHVDPDAIGTLYEAAYGIIYDLSETIVHERAPQNVKRDLR